MSPIRSVRFVTFATVVACACLASQAIAAESVESDPIIRVLATEADYALNNLVAPDGAKPYYVAYTITETQNVSISAVLGALRSDDRNRSRVLDVDIRVGDYKLDNTHKIREGGYSFDFFDFFGGATEISLEDDMEAIRQQIWLATDRAFKSAARKHARVLTNIKVKVEEEDKSDDFSREEPNVFGEEPVSLSFDGDEWAQRLRKHSARFRHHPLIYSSGVSLRASATNRYMVNTEGTRLRTGRKLIRLSIHAATKAEDGMDLFQRHIFNTASESALPDDTTIDAAIQKVVDQVLGLRAAPLVEPYTGPAILVNRASGVFFHEIFGHRIEGHRQKDVEEGQTFTKKIGQLVLPEFLSVFDDPTQARFGGVDLRGHYRYDDEGVASRPVTLVENGVLKTFLLSRSPVKGFPKSNAHGRREPGHDVVSRQGNLIVRSSKHVGFDELRAELLRLCKDQDKPYGMLFEDISGGFTSTGRRGPQSFKVLPIIVYRVYADGQPDELVRGVDIVGTPLSCFDKIVLTADDDAVFNGTCGAESGWVPVSAVSPSILVSQIEIEKRQRDQDKPPILPAPIAETMEGA